MRALITILILAGLGSAQIFGPGGVPVDWRDLGIEWMESSKFTTAGATNYLSMTSSAAADTLLWTQTGAPGDRDMVLAFVDESGNKRTLILDDAGPTFAFSHLVNAPSAVLGGDLFSIRGIFGGSKLYLSAPGGTSTQIASVSSAPSILIDPNASGAGTTIIGVVGHGDSLAVIGNASFSGTVDVVSDLDVGGDLTVVGAGDDVVVGAYIRRECIEAGAVPRGPTAPDFAVIGTVLGLAFDADAEEAYLRFSVPDDWDGVSDMTLVVAWMSQSGDALEDTETVIWEIAYRSLLWGTEVADNGTAVTDTETYTQAGAGTDKATITSTFVIDYDNADQPLVAGDCLSILFSRQYTTDTYTGDGIVIAWSLFYTSTGLAR